MDTIRFNTTKLLSENTGKFCIVKSEWNSKNDVKFEIFEYEKEVQTISGEWEGSLDCDYFKRSAEELDMPLDMFLDECKSVLFGNNNNGEQSNLFCYKIDNEIFKLQKNEEIKCIYLEIPLKNSPNLRDKLILTFANTINQQKKELKEAEMKLEILNLEYQTVVQKFEDIVKLKNSLETELLSKFAALLNSKKSKIADLQFLLKEKSQMLENSQGKQNNGQAIESCNINDDNSAYVQPTQRLPRRKQLMDKSATTGITEGNPRNSPKPCCSKDIVDGKSLSPNIYDNDTEEMLF